MPTAIQSALKNRMDYLVSRQNILSQNIANANTPGYLARDLAAPQSGSSFAMAVTNAQHLAGNTAAGGGKLTTSTDYIQHNGNSVRLDQEMVKLNDTQLNYRMMTELYTKQRELTSIALRGQ